MKIRALAKSLKRLGRKLQSERGFTLVELLVTVTIIGILAAVVTVGVSGVASSSQTKANQALFSAHQTLIDAWLAANPLKDPDTQVPMHANGSGFSCGAGATNTDCAVGTTFAWYTANGALTSNTFTAVVVANGGTTASQVFRSVNPTSTDGDGSSTQFKKFFRLGNAASTTLCVVSTTASNNVIACKN